MFNKINPIATSEQIKERYQICAGCTYSSQSAFGMRCIDCGCMLTAKIPLKVSTCPQNKW